MFQIRDGKPTFDTLDNFHSFVGVFCGYPTDKVEQFREYVESFEMIWKSKYNLKPDQEFKSTNIRKNNFEYGFASLKGNNRKFYIEKCCSILAYEGKIREIRDIDVDCVRLLANKYLGNTSAKTVDR